MLPMACLFPVVMVKILYAADLHVVGWGEGPKTLVTLIKSLIVGVLSIYFQTNRILVWLARLSCYTVKLTRHFLTNQNGFLEILSLQSFETFYLLLLILRNLVKSFSDNWTLKLNYFNSRRLCCYCCCRHRCCYCCRQHLKHKMLLYIWGISGHFKERSKSLSWHPPPSSFHISLTQRMQIDLINAK